MEYETREASRAYLTKPDPDRKNDNVDFHHIYHAYQAIRDWFAPRKTLRNDMESAFLNKVKVIWYEVATAEDPISILTRLIIGKIPLTNAELVKGLFLRASNFAAGEPVLLCPMKQATIAQEWDDIERRLQEDSFWYFLTNRTTTSNRIDFLLRLRADEIATAHVLPDEPSYVSLAFAEHLNRDGVDHAAEWARIKQLFMQLDDWYRDREFYHLIGFLTATGAAIPTVVQLGHGRSKRAFRASLKSPILEQVLRSRTALDRSTVAPALQEHLDDLDYDSVKTRRLLTCTVPENIAEVTYTPVTAGDPFLSIRFGDGQKFTVIYQGGHLVCRSDDCVVAAPDALERLMAEFSGPVVA